MRKLDGRNVEWKYCIEYLDSGNWRKLESVIFTGTQEAFSEDIAALERLALEHGVVSLLLPDDEKDGDLEDLKETPVTFVVKTKMMNTLKIMFRPISNDRLEWDVYKAFLFLC